MVWQVDLSGQTIVITGGNRGIGLSISHQVAQAGANLAIIYRSSKDAPAVAKDIADKYGVKARAYQADVTNQTAIREVYKQVYAELGPINGVVCNAGVNAKGSAYDITKEDFDFHFNNNVWGVFVCAQAAALLWREHSYKKGRIVFISSISASIANKGEHQPFYNPSKSAVNSLARTLAMDWASDGINVTCVSPGFVNTEMNARLVNDPEFKKTVDDGIMLGRVSTPDEQAGAVVFFLSEYASYITGTELRIDGGSTAW